ncbi:hypothetical protein CCACVL1_18718 [Corchorus capsularis]|uniref:DUF4220 domain-containing protein n=1 Tax=Corchorus capsularis TaxID=210143 RepID=A0A1R3HK13_COCAP|nr:hypothetical protein CCACVL1_18718 [Corchorus capsularis]
MLSTNRLELAFSNIFGGKKVGIHQLGIDLTWIGHKLEIKKYLSMLLSIASGVFFTEVSKWAADRSGLPGPSKEFWNKVELCSLVLLSLFLHCVLIWFGGYGSNRKGNRSIIFLAWLAYFLGDWVATASLTTLLKRQLQKLNAIEVLWAPFILLHLGKAETMAANYFEESTLWLRYLIGLLIQLGIAIYIYWRFPTKHFGFTFLATLIYIAGIIKCGERIWILSFSSFEKYRKSMLRAPAPEIPHSSEGKFDIPKHELLVAYLQRKGLSQEAEHLHQAYLSFKMFVPLFSGLKLRIYKKLENIFNLQESLSAEEAFKLVDIELEFLYDMLYTKTVILNSVTGLILLSISLFSCVLGLIAFTGVIARKSYNNLDVAITYLLLLGAVSADTYALLTQLLSKWTMRRCTKPGSKKRPKLINKVINHWLEYRKKGRGIKSMPQSSLLKYCLKSKAITISAVAKKLHLGNTVIESFLHQLDMTVQRAAWFTWINVDLELKDFIFGYLKEKRRQYKEKQFEFKSLTYLINAGAYELLRRKQIHEEVGWSLKDLEFTHSLILWHIATDILYYDQKRRYPNGSFSTHCRISKHLSDYMMHLLLKAPFMLRKGIGEIRYRDTCMEAVKFFNQEMKLQGVRLAATTLLAIDAECRGFLFQMKGQGKSVFFAASALATSLRKLSRDENWRMDEEEVWEIISCVWVELLVSAANHCDWKDHKMQLRHGKELLTHVALLMAHLGLSKHIRMTDPPPQLEAEDGYNPPWNWAELNRLAYYLA